MLNVPNIDENFVSLRPTANQSDMDELMDELMDEQPPLVCVA